LPVEAAEVRDDGAAGLGFRVGGGPLQPVYGLPARFTGWVADDRSMGQGGRARRSGFLELPGTKPQASQLEGGDAAPEQHRQTEQHHDGGLT
jgi:hypothetical protein